MTAIEDSNRTEKFLTPNLGRYISAVLRPNKRQETQRTMNHRKKKVTERR
jgi:hypothetical protein